MIQTSVKHYVEAQHSKQMTYEESIGALMTRIKRIERESEDLRLGLVNEQLKSHQDTLTGLPNRLAYQERSRLEFLRARRQKTDLTLAIIDLDFFKIINDNYGHKVGDKVLRHSAQLCLRRARKTDLLARFGGDEFVALFPDTSAAGARHICEDLRCLVEQAAFQCQSRWVPVSVSIGVAGLQPGETLSALFERADAALYTAKRRGRNRVQGP